jgi:hypothetical protein
MPSKEVTRLALAKERRREHRKGTKEYRNLTTEIRALKRRLNMATPYRYDLDLASDLLAALDAAEGAWLTTQQLLLVVRSERAKRKEWIPCNKTMEKTVRQLEQEGAIEAQRYEGGRVQKMGERWGGIEGNKVRPRRWRIVN